MNRYYSESKPFAWLRKKLQVQKPYALPLGEWDSWHANFKTTRPLAYWLTETLPDWLEKPAEWVLDPVSDLKYYIRNRWVSESHKMPTGLAPGQHHEVDQRMLHGLFTTLVDFVEVEKAHMQVIWGNALERKKYNLPWWRRIHWFRWKAWRNPQAGLDYLAWETTLVNNADWFSDPNDPLIGKPTSQAEAAKEVLALYHWWKSIRPQRPDHMDASGWSAYCDRVREKHGSIFGDYGKQTEAEQEECKVALQKSTELEQQYEDEDTEMMIRLIRVRGSLWT